MVVSMFRSDLEAIEGVELKDLSQDELLELALGLDKYSKMYNDVDKGLVEGLVKDLYGVLKRESSKDKFKSSNKKSTEFEFDPTLDPLIVDEELFQEFVDSGMNELFEVTDTLIIGKQSPKNNYDAEGNVSVSYHKKPIGYAIKNLINDKKYVLTTLEVTAQINSYKAVNARSVMAVYKKKTNDGKVIKTPSPHIKSNGKYEKLQSHTMVCDPDYFFSKEENADAFVSPKFRVKLLSKGSYSTPSSDSSNKYSPDDIRNAIKSLQERGVK